MGASQTSSASPQPPAGATASITGPVWDWPTRLVHWALALSVPASWITAKGFDLLDLHMTIGYVTLGLVAFRVTWGFVGPRHARFASFVRGPVAVGQYVTASLPRRDAPPSVGHNPLGGLVVVLILAMLALQAITGLFATDELLHLGPYYGAVSEDTAEDLTSVHRTNGDLLLWLAGIHVAAIGFYALYKRQNLVGPMLTGRRTLPSARVDLFIDSQRTLLALVLAAVVTGAVLALLSFAPPPPPADDFF